MPARLVEVPAGDALPALARHINALVASGHWVLLVTARTAGRELLERLPGLGVNLDHVVVADVATPPERQSGADNRRLVYMPGPQLLELLALRSEKLVWARRREKTHILVYDLNAFARYNAPEALEQMMRYVMGRVRTYTTVDLCVDPSDPLPSRLQSSLEAFCDQRMALD